ncbi:fasciclin domain-containing protein [Antrihabitans sp. YC3-6]|uniref:Fasciclin domain-containing protein n=1 Tax=Antrihabitans stalagmiti TaxID=2799499 RepID=A0A934U6J3_9NOCA|nr:fasciclin domain-containing protein [Antrihabitans stalagmiti]MBJ8342512.1 fasciclin domain-containing protein [Antrihabitans stalagmiti]
MRIQRKIAIASIAALGVVGLSACSDDSSSDSADATTTAAAATSESMSTSSAADPAAGLVGPGCAGYAAQVPSGAGSVSGMAADPVATAASNNPLLTTLVAAVSGQLNPGVNLVDTLNGGEFTVFAPVDDAFKAVDPATIETLKTDSALLTKILTYHVVPGQIAPDAIAGSQTTVEGQPVEVSGSGDALKVNGASVICGGVKTANATVYLIDQVLTPPAA